MKAKQVVVLLAMLLVLPLCLFSQTFYQGVVKPVDVRDYDGTYDGISGTGGFGYKTLYRDNYLGPPPIGGEGKGRHPGVDITCPSGTSVQAIANGTIFKSEDDNRVDATGKSIGWGGLIVIKHEVGSIPGITEPVYSVYAHLKQRYFTIFGTSVTKGDVIGLSGGGTSDPNHGNSTGSHLHFQIDRDFRLTNGIVYVNHPFWGGDPNQTDSDHKIDANTHHPMHFLRYLMLVPVGFYSSGWLPTNHSQSFLDAYLADGTLGRPIDNGGGAFVHWWSDAGQYPLVGVWIQDFHNPTTNIQR